MIFRQDDVATPEPARVTASFDAANAYAEGKVIEQAKTPQNEPAHHAWLDEAPASRS